MAKGTRSDDPEERLRTAAKIRESRLARKFRTWRYHVRVQFQGSIKIVCPYCGNICMRRISRRHWRFKCTDCKAWFIPVINLAALPKGGRTTTPPDFVIPDLKGPRALQEAFPTGDLQFWQQGNCVHGMTRGRSAEDFIREVRIRASSGGQNRATIEKAFEEVAAEWQLESESTD